MKTRATLALLAAAALAACSKAPVAPADSGEVHMHHAHAPHGGTVLKLGDDAYHIELVLNPATGTLQAFVLDDELEDFVRSSSPSIEITAHAGGAYRDLVLLAVANPVTGETVGDTSLFEASADWLKVTPEFDGVVKSVTVRGATFNAVAFNFPNRNGAAP